MHGSAEGARQSVKADGRLPDMSSFSSSLLNSGYYKLPGGLILQWGSVVARPEGVSITFPIAFPNTLLKFLPAMTNGPTLGTFSAGTSTQTGAVVYTSLATASMSWFALGN